MDTAAAGISPSARRADPAAAGPQAADQRRPSPPLPVRRGSSRSIPVAGCYQAQALPRRPQGTPGQAGVEARRAGPVRHHAGRGRGRENQAHWQKDPDLASVRDRSALDRLPEHERAAWQALWREVDELLSRVAQRDEPIRGRNVPETPKTKPDGRSLPPSGATGR
jgi:hypothetical protein